MPADADAEGAAVLILSGPRLADGRTVDVRISTGLVEAVGTPGSLTPSPGAGTTRVDLSGYLLLPAPAEPHAHHDTALTADDDGPPSTDPSALRRRMTEAALLQLGHGATAQRTHIRIGDVTALSSLEAALDARRGLRGLTDLQVVAVPRRLTGRAGADDRALLHDAAKMGVTALGGNPDLDPDPAGYLDVLVETAAEHGCGLDLHTGGDDPAGLARLAAAAGGLRGEVAVGPCAGLSRLPAEAAGRAAEQLAGAGVTVVCLPQGPCGLLEEPRPAAGTTPVRLLRSAGVRVAAGSGALRDHANAVGRGDPLEAAYLLASHGEAGPVDAYAAVSTRSREALGLPPVRIESGHPAELLAVRGDSLSGALALAYSRIVIHRGRVVARTSAVREYCGTAAPAAPGLPRQATG
ncbi:amidohydrolase family protein [Streptomyces otsuchiensis]|uniref:amidohydrolase family protein n=1 Tax=Streptomyces otsuchiensis TaxID=2681388 RepID=UPI001031BC11|nr:amidohydrolase family protein [Streptomyces otsuchiensis]